MRPAFKYPGIRGMVNIMSNAEDVLTEIRVNLLECKVCLESFTLQTREHAARNLPCGHVLCLKCVRALSHPVRQTLECPFCREPCEAGRTSECRALADLQELLSYPRPSAHRPEINPTEGLRSRALSLRWAFGGWGTIINPCGIAVIESSRQVVVVHDGEMRVSVFTQQGMCLYSFGCYGHGPVDVCHPLDVAVASSGHVVVTDAGDETLKVFDSHGCPAVIVRDSFKLPWGVAIDARGQILVTDAQSGTLSQLVLDLSRGVVLVNRVVVKHLTCPRSVACCGVSGHVAVVENLGSFQGSTCLKIFSNDFVVLSQVTDSVRIFMSCVSFDRSGDVIVGDAQRGMVWSLGKPHMMPVLTPLVSGLMRPAGLMLTDSNVLIVLDGGDHAVKFYTEFTEDCEKT